MAERTIPANGVKIDVKTEKGLPRIMGDKEVLAESFSHLLVNALEALQQDKGGTIEVTASTNTKANGVAPGVLVTVHDNAKGIPDDLQDKVFGPFCTTKARGIGLGLPIVRRTVTDHNGRVTIESGDRGTTVAIALPAADIEQGNANETNPRGR